MKVLIVDDNRAIRGAVRNLFETDPIFQVWGEAENGREAIQKTAELRPELIIMDSFYADFERIGCGLRNPTNEAGDSNNFVQWL